MKQTSLYLWKGKLTPTSDGPSDPVNAKLSKVGL